jgi:cephalosporin hydroxylase
MSWDRDRLETDRSKNLARMLEDPELTKSGLALLRRSYEFDYAYQWSWAGFPIIQMPEDIVMVQEIVWRNRPSVIIECGAAWGAEWRSVHPS